MARTKARASPKAHGAILKSTSQAGQDRFVRTLIPNRKGTFLDIGAWPFVGNSNSHSLELIGWKGLLVDLCSDGDGLKQRKSPFVKADATNADWVALFRKYQLPATIDYLSLDVDEFTTETLIGLPLDKLKFRVLTVEHDSYWLGPGPRDKHREILKAAGYDLICEDVMVEFPTPGSFVCFEDWWVAPEMRITAKRFRSKGKLWSEIVA